MKQNVDSGHAAGKTVSQGMLMYMQGMKHKGEKYVFGALVPKDNPDYTGPWDCAEFTSWLVYQITGKLYGCANNEGAPDTADAYTGFWARDAEKMGTKVDINAAVQTPGALLLRVSAKGQIGHIVVSDGKGGTIEAHSTKTGVIQGRVTGRRWDYGILIPWMSYTETPIPEVKEVNKKPTAIIYRFTSPLMTGLMVQRIQKALKMKAADVDGKFGQQTFNMVRAFQLKKGLVPDGEVGPETLKALGL